MTTSRGEEFFKSENGWSMSVGYKNAEKVSCTKLICSRERAMIGLVFRQGFQSSAAATTVEKIIEHEIESFQAS